MNGYLSFIDTIKEAKKYKEKLEKFKKYITSKENLDYYSVLKEKQTEELDKVVRRYK